MEEVVRFGLIYVGCSIMLYLSRMITGFPEECTCKFGVGFLAFVAFGVDLFLMSWSRFRIVFEM